ncbi:MAG: right-handed parallel beta-helix repeat-containing protein [Ignavibacteriales bacterium]|nr:right-handed parallel beta-helix repeat-containing protein [Ignavibacteriales bacterium]
MKRLLVLFVLLFTVFFSYTVVAQEFGSIRKSVEYSFPEKIHKLVLDPLPAGTYSIGTGGDFPTIDSAFNKLSIDGIAGEVILELIDNLYTAPTTELGFSLNGPITGAGSTSRVIIKPAANKNVTIEGSGENILNFINTSYLTLDGVDLTGSTTLTIHSLYNIQYSWNTCADFWNNSDHNVVQNIIFISDDYTRNGGGPGFWTRAGQTETCDSNLIQNNFIKKAGWGIYVSSYNSSLRAEGNIIKGNLIGSHADSLIAWGIQVEHCHNTVIENNIIQNLKVTTTVGEILIPGINSYWGSGDIIRNNIVHGIKASGGYSGVGILLSGQGSWYGSNNLVYNNMVYDIQSTSTQNDSRVAGIQVWMQQSPKIYYNSVYLTGKAANHFGSGALYIWNTCTNVEAKNNILINKRDESPYCASAIYIQGSSTYLTNSDYNDLFFDTNPYNCLVRTSGINYNDLLEWQATGKDFHSVTEMPNFIVPDLHIDESVATNLEKRAAPIAGIDNDCDGELRNVNLPDIGADEFDGIIPPGPLTFGTYSVGTNGFFNTIESVFTKLETDGITGAVTLELIDELFTAPADTFGFLLDGPIAGAGPNSRITIKPAANKNIILEGNGQNVLCFMNTSYLTLDGVDLSGATTLTVHSIANTQFDKNNGVGFYDNSDNNVIKNLNIVVDDYLRISFAIFIGGATNLLALPDSNLIENNFIKKAGIAICLSYGNGNIIKQNNIGSGTDSLISWGIQSQMTNNTLIENNHVQNLRFGIHYECPGIDSYLDNGCIIRNNIVHNIDGKNARDGGFGIELSGDSGNPGINNMVYNNMVYDIGSSSNRAAGIQLWYVNNSKIYYNTVYLFGNGTGTTTNGSAALYISHSCTNVEAKNNILVNTRDESPYYASAIYDYSSSNLTSDYNDLYSDNYLVRIGNTNYNSLAEWQITGKDKHSITEMPNFIEPYLHIDESVATNLEKGATPIEGIDTDFDEDTRNATTPDIGADEFDGVVGIEEETTLPTEFALEQNYPNPFNPSTIISWQSPVSSWQTLKVYDVLGNEVATLINEYKPAGMYNVQFTMNNFASGVYFYQLKAGEYISTKKMLLLK